MTEDFCVYVTDIYNFLKSKCDFESKHLASCKMISKAWNYGEKKHSQVKLKLVLYCHCLDDAIILIIGAYLIMTSLAGHKVTIKSTKIWGVVLQHSHAITFTWNIKWQK